MSRVSSLIRKVLGASKHPPKPPGGVELGMTVRSEQTFCRHFTRDRYTAQGEIVDLGCWMGATTISFSKGLRQTTRLTGEQIRKRIHSYDLFRWHPSMEANVQGTPLAGKYREGESFLPEFERRTAQYQEYFTVHPGNLNEHPWKGGPIEMLFIDAMKWSDTAQSIVRGFYPHLIPGVSLVAHQDFAHFYTGWIHLIQYRLRDYFDCDSEVKRSCTVVFKLKQAIPQQLLERDCMLENADLAEINAAFDYSASIVSRDKQEQIAAARAMTHVHRGELDLAEKVAREFMWAHVGDYLYRGQRPDMVDLRTEVETARRAASSL